MVTGQLRESARFAYGCTKILFLSTPLEIQFFYIHLTTFFEE
jgi:hypothetical protein